MESTFSLLYSCDINYRSQRATMKYESNFPHVGHSDVKIQNANPEGCALMCYEVCNFTYHFMFDSWSASAFWDHTIGRQSQRSTYTYKIGCLPQLDTNDLDEVSHRCLLVFWRAVREVCDELAERNAGSDTSAAVITSCYGLASSPVTHTRVHTN